MKTLQYKIEMLSDWHIGSGLDAATDADALVLKNDLNQPYIPGKTIKGLMKDAVMDMTEIQTKEEAREQFQQLMDSVFGKILDNGKGKTEKGKAYFSNATLCEVESNEIYNNELSKFLYRNIASTAIGKNGVAKPKSLRVMQVALPVTLVGSIANLEDEEFDLLKKAIRLVRHLGANRNRGLGRCKFSKAKTIEKS